MPHRTGAILAAGLLGIAFAIQAGMKSLPVPVAKARENIADVLETVRQGGRVRITRHGRPVGWIIGEKERNRLSQPASSDPTVAKRRARSR